MNHSASLFQPFTCKSLHLPNRIVMAPMTRSFSPGGVPTDAERLITNAVLRLRWG